MWVFTWSSLVHNTIACSYQGSNWGGTSLLFLQNKLERIHLLSSKRKLLCSPPPLSLPKKESILYNFQIIKKFKIAIQLEIVFFQWMFETNIRGPFSHRNCNKRCTFQYEQSILTSYLDFSENCTIKKRSVTNRLFIDRQWPARNF